MEPSTTSQRPSRAARAFHVLGACALLVWLLSPMLDVLLLGFAGLLLAIFLSGIGAMMASRSFLSQRWATGIVVIVLASATVLVGRLVAPDLARQVNELGEALPRALRELLAYVGQYPGGDAIVERLSDPGKLLAGTEALSRARGVLSSTAGALASFMAFLFIGLFVALEPKLYRGGLLRLVPLPRRERADEVLTKVAHALRLWMLSKLLAMTVVGAATWLGLSLLNVPLAFILAMLSALLTFIPNFGPVISAVPPVLLALADSPSRALFVVLLYVGVQTVESYLITPLIERKTVALPPALTIAAQLGLGVIAGGVGVVVATPLVAVALVLVKQLYVEDMLGDVVQAAPD